MTMTSTPVGSGALIPFGKYRGTPVRHFNTPDRMSYLYWMRNNAPLWAKLPGTLKDAITKHIGLVLILALSSCSPKYDVVQQLSPNRYHLQGVKHKDVIILITDKDLKEGQVVKWKEVKKQP